jgi:hypothetical protein
LWSSEELLIDFKEIQGEHSGENLSALVWETMDLYGLKEKVCILSFCVLIEKTHKQ